MIRRATTADISALVEIGARMAAESPEWAGMGYSGQKVAALLANLIDSPRGFVAVADRDGLSGVIVAAASEHWACDCLVAFELALYVDQDARGAVVGLQLIKAYRDWVAANGFKRGTAGVTTGLQTERTAVLYERAGARRLGVVFDFGGA